MEEGLMERNGMIYMAVVVVAFPIITCCSIIFGK